MGNELERYGLDHVLQARGKLIALIDPGGEHRERKTAQDYREHDQADPSLDPHAGSEPDSEVSGVHCLPISGVSMSGHSVPG